MKYGDMPPVPKYTAQVKGDAGVYDVWGFNWYSYHVCISRAGVQEWVCAKKVKLTLIQSL
jgi:hypothetical protein